MGACLQYLMVTVLGFLVWFHGGYGIQLNSCLLQANCLTVHFGDCLDDGKELRTVKVSWGEPSNCTKPIQQKVDRYCFRSAENTVVQEWKAGLDNALEIPNQPADSETCVFVADGQPSNEAHGSMPIAVGSNGSVSHIQASCSSSNGQCGTQSSDELQWCFKVPVCESTVKQGVSVTACEEGESYNSITNKCEKDRPVMNIIVIDEEFVNQRQDDA